MTPTQREMFHITNVAVASVKDRALKALTPDGTSAKPLTKRYAIKKTRLRGVFGGFPRSNKRDLHYTGRMMANFQVRTVSDTKGQARNSTVRDRAKAAANDRRQQWAAYSQENVRTVVKAANAIKPSIAGRIIKGIGFQRVKGQGVERFRF